MLFESHRVVHLGARVYVSLEDVGQVEFNPDHLSEIFKRSIEYNRMTSRCRWAFDAATELFTQDSKEQECPYED